MTVPLEPVDLDTVVRWFAEAASGAPLNENELTAFVGLMNGLSRLKQNPAFPTLTIGADLRQARLGKAAREIAEVIPEMISHGELAGDELDNGIAFNYLAEWFLQCGLIGDPPKPGKRGQRWHAAARLVAEHAHRAWTVAGHPPPFSHQTADSPIVHVVALALHRLDGEAPSHETIADQLKKNPPAWVKLKREFARGMG